MSYRWRCKDAQDILSSVEQGAQERSQTSEVAGADSGCIQSCIRLVGTVWALDHVHSEIQEFTASSTLPDANFFHPFCWPLIFDLAHPEKVVFG